MRPSMFLVLLSQLWWMTALVAHDSVAGFFGGILLFMAAIVGAWQKA